MKSRNIDDLPPELLREIYHLTVLPHDVAAEMESPAPLALHLSQVCSRWRAISLASQALWATILPRMNVFWTKECLARSPSASFALVISSGYFTDDEYRAATHLVLSHISRANSLRIKIKEYNHHNTTALLDLIHHFCTSEVTTKYEELSIGLSFDPRVYIPIMLPPHLLSGQQPGLLCLFK